MDLSPIVLAHEPAFAIGDAEIRPATREIVTSGKTTILEPRVMQLLVALHRADGGVVSKDDLAKLCWEGRIVGEDAINRVVSRLRAVAEKDAGGAFRIETITKVGYRLARTNGGTTPSAASPERASRTRVTRRQMVVGGAVATIAAAAGGTWIIRSRDRMPAAARSLVEDADKDLWSGVIDQESNAVAKLRQAAQEAPDSAEVWGRLAYAYINAARGAPASEGPELRERGTEAMRRAFSLEADEPHALAAQAMALPVYRNWLANEAAHRAALRKAPGNAPLMVGLAYLMVQVGRPRDAVGHLDRARTLLPPSPRIESLRMNSLWGAGMFDDADTAVADALKLWPRHYGVWFTYLYYLMYNGRAAEAVGMIADVATRPIGIPEWNFDLVAAQAKALATRDPADRRKGLEASIGSAHRGTGFAENAAQFAGFVGEFDTAFAILNALYFNRGFAMPDSYFAEEQGMYSKQERHTYNLFVQPLKALRRDARFASLTREIGLDDYWKRSGSRPQVSI